MKYEVFPANVLQRPISTFREAKGLLSGVK